jgi:DNA phosphorothioation-dependent restriction protein DptG
MYISDSLIKDQIKQVISKINAHVDCPTNNDSDNERICKAYHIEFEGIHPFEDGNGRVGRILLNVHRISVGLPILIIHEGAEQMKYYEWFRETQP